MTDPKPSVSLDYIQAKLAEIAGYDDEIAHSALDGLYIDVLKAIAAGATDGDVLAAAALEGEELKFSRWYA